MSRQLKRLGDLADLINGHPFDSADFGDSGDVPLVRIRDILSQSFQTFVPGEVVPKSAYIQDDDIVIGMDGDFNLVHWRRGTAALNQRLCALRASDSADSRFLAYALPSHFKIIHDLSYATTVKHLASGQIRQLRIATPHVAEQRTIADYLDRETARIDTLIVEQQRLIGFLRERRAAVRDHAYAHAFEKRATNVGRVLRPLHRPAIPGLGVVTAYRDGVVTLRSNRRNDGYTFSGTEYGYQEVRVGDLVFHALDGFAGAVGISDSQGNATPVYHVCETVGHEDSAYIASLLRYLGTSGFLATQAPNVRERSVDFRNWTTFARVPLTLPPLDEQRRVVAYLNEQTAKIDALITETERFIELARERRTAIITAAVTGQIDVTTSQRTSRAPSALRSGLAHEVPSGDIEQILEETELGYSG